MAKARKVETALVEPIGGNKAHVCTDAGRVTKRPIPIWEAASLTRYLNGGRTDA